MTPAHSNSHLVYPIVADTGATGHFFEHTNKHHYLHTSIPFKNTKATTNGITVLLPDSGTLKSTHTAELDIPSLPLAARQTHLFPHLASGSLLSIGQLCDHGCTAHFSKSKLYIFYQQKLIMQGTRQPSKLWTIDPVHSTPHSCNTAIDSPTIAERIRFYHASLFSPTLETLCKAIDSNYLTTFPGFTSSQVRKFPPISVATYKGHLNAQRANTRSTKKVFKSPNFLFNVANFTPTTTQLPNLIPAEEDELEPLPSPVPVPVLPTVPIPSPVPALVPPTLPIAPSQPIRSTLQAPVITLPFHQQTHSQVSPNENMRTHFVYPACITPTNTISTDQTGAFPITSISGNKYIFVIYDYDSNLIYGIPIPSRSKAQLTSATSTILTLLKSRGLKPKLQRLDNEISKELEELLDNEGIDYQLTPTGMHRRNSAEKAVQIYKNHFISGLCTTNPSFPTNLWDKLIPQANITLNLLRASRINPQLSAYAQVFGAFDYNKTPLAPPGIAILQHIRPEKRQTWAPHALSGFYIGPALKHYRNHRVWLTATQAERIADKLQWLPHNNIKMPTASRESIILAAAADLTNAIASQHQNPLLPPVNTQTRIILQQLHSIFQNKLKPSLCPTVTPTAPPPLPGHHQPSIKWNNTLIQPATPPTIVPSNTPLVSSLRMPLAPPASLPRTPPTVAQLPRVPPPIVLLPAPPTVAQLPRVPPPIVPLSMVPPPVVPGPTRTPLPRVQIPISRLAQVPQPPSPSPSVPSVPPPRRSTRTCFRNPRYVTQAALNAVLNKETGKMEQYKQLLQGKDRDLWANGMSKEMARLTQGRKQNDVPYHDVMTWMHPRDIPKGLRATYMRVVANFRPQTSEKRFFVCVLQMGLKHP